ncbi:Hypothetical predicted protein [Mytilus galloprovincialis]|uniref:Uncharacterized protein n=1 Tax=Mytilus galloprovincialis TaxID=29158 RepID=A0A8B6G4W8_MYTGA|nr:Hypothetical predicted protein [Mytilus galloprovincialis]
MYGTGNNLLLSVNADIESKIALAGVRALGLVDVHINRPLWKLLDCNDVSITDMSQYYQKLHDSISNLVQDSSPMFDENYQMFENYPPEKDLFGFFALHAVEENNEELDVLTTQALELILASILSVIKRQLVDHLTGGKHSDPNEDLMLISQSVPKTNQSNESNFGQLDRIKRFKPNATTAHIEGMVLYVNNKTSDWLDTQCNEADIMQKLKYYKCVLSFEGNNAFYKFSSEGKAFSVEMLKNNLIKIIQKYSSNIHIGVEIDLDVPRKEEHLRPLTERNELLKSEKDNLKNVRVVKKQSAVLSKNGIHNSNKTRKRKLENEKEVTSAVKHVKKHKRSHDVKINTNMTFISNYKDFKVNQWIAVAGLSDWYIGQVEDILSEETATVNFMERSNTNACTFKWCSPPAVETTYIKTVNSF